MKHRTAADRAREHRMTRASDARAAIRTDTERAAGDRQLKLELATRANRTAQSMRGERTQCPECGRWNYHLATCSQRRPMP